MSDSTHAGLSDADLAAIRERSEAALAGPWDLVEVEPDPEYGEYDPHWYVQFSEFKDSTCLEHKPTAEFLAAARQDVPALLAEVERLRAELVQARETNCRLHRRTQDAESIESKRTRGLRIDLDVARLVQDNYHDRIKRTEADLDEQKRLNLALAERVAAQAECMSRVAERAGAKAAAKGENEAYPSSEAVAALQAFFARYPGLSR